MMKATATILACLTLALTAQAANAAVWEGSADAGDIAPGETYVIATNSFPRNTNVDVTNLENNRTVRVLVIAGQDNSGLLATLSRDAADVIGIRGDSVRRVRITPPSNEIAFAHIKRGPLFDPRGIDDDPDPNQNLIGGGGMAEPKSPDPLVPVIPPPITGIDDEEDPVIATPSTTEPGAGDTGEPVTGVSGSGDDKPALVVNGTPPVLVGGTQTAEPVAPPVTAPPAPPATTTAQPATSKPELVFTLVPTSERLPPILQQLIPPEYIIPAIDPNRPAASAVPPARTGNVPEPATVASAVPPARTDGVPQPVAAVVPHDFSPFGNVPLVSRLERNRWYVQLGTFARVESVENEIDRIATAHPYPLLIQNVGTDMDPMFHILLGPLNQGESAAVLNRVRSVGNVNAFVKVAD